MRNINTISKFEYLCATVFWACFTFIIYRPLLLYDGVELEYLDSVQMLAVVVTVLTGIGLPLTFSKRRNYLSIFINVVGAYTVHFMVSFRKVFPRTILFTLALATILSLCYIAWVLYIYFKERNNQTVIVSFRTCLTSCILSARTVFFFVISCLLIVTIVKSRLDIPLINTQTEAREGKTIAKNIDTVLLLQEEQWEILNVEERLRVMKIISEIECNYLGITPVNVVSNVLDFGTLGGYNNDTHTITLNLSSLVSQDAHTMLHAITHEAYHAYQYELVRLYDSLDPRDQKLLCFSDTEKYKEEFTNYIQGIFDYQAYASQACEEDSDDYADSAVYDYYRRIDEYLQENAS